MENSTNSFKYDMACLFLKYKNIFYLLKNRPNSKDETYSAYIESQNEVLSTEKKMYYPPQQMHHQMIMPQSI